ncbi:DUF397 domain-containing protein [Streptomyces profundus]|uniref:DUF397 domain-containing protein n=1 Tax=Streptomyces profundus TaxID=2867410 RepID=UPI001D15EBA7|nr:DUF397 domain-containing protein [Streptomyces sp. MA3_2.13]UED86564.1 DUF397 domain-containing protein [Streptomyces sp. MA3_2.13]
MNNRTDHLTNLTWRTSSYSNGTGNCVEIAPTAGAVAVRDTKHHDAGTALFSETAWHAFLQNTANRP